MSLHYPHDVGTSRAAAAGSSRPAEQSMQRYFLAERRATSLRPTWWERAAVLWGMLVLLITAWLIWGAIAEASAARAGIF